MFPYIFMRGDQARLCQIRQRFTYPLQLSSDSFLSRLCILVVSFKCCRTRQPWDGTISFMVLSFMNAQARSSGSSRPSALPHVNEFIKFLELLLLAAPYSIAPLALTDGLWSLTCSFFFIIFCLFRKKKKEKGIYWWFLEQPLLNAWTRGTS